jgi:hypothetical protein
MSLIEPLDALAWKVLTWVFQNCVCLDEDLVVDKPCLSEQNILYELLLNITRTATIRWHCSLIMSYLDAKSSRDQLEALVIYFIFVLTGNMYQV